MEDLVGQKFGRLTVHSLSEKRNKFNHLHWKCTCECGAIVVVPGNNLKKGNTKSCGCYRKDLQKAKQGNKNPAWKGGITYNRDGYAMIRVPMGELATKYVSGVNPRKRYILEHHYVMALALGRALDSRTESIHHLNGNRKDNKLENLELREAYHPRGLSAGDRIKDAITCLVIAGYKIYREGKEINGNS